MFAYLIITRRLVTGGELNYVETLRKEEAERADKAEGMLDKALDAMKDQTDLLRQIQVEVVRGGHGN